MEHKLNFERKVLLTTKPHLSAGISLWRKIINNLMTVLVIIAVALAIIPLILILGDVFMRGAPALSIGFLIHLQKPPNVSGGGIANAIVGTFTMVGIAALISVPIGIGAGIFFSEWSTSKLSAISGFMNDVLTGFPSIVLGLFVFVIIVYPTKQFSAFAGGIALSFVMLPIIARTTGESLKLVPMTLREASMALGIPRWKTVLRIVISTRKKRAFNGHTVGRGACNRRNGSNTINSFYKHLLCKKHISANSVNDSPHLQLRYFTVLILANSGVGSSFSVDTHNAWVESSGKAYSRKKCCRKKNGVIE